eukprot:TRINITY_DN30446_c0_g1_i1.p1 TRINITY_DN30446_c0_g1~~TRINITY_DN30446_c0_g1_i1.p1  ORF type:complete len:996 (+),score=388.76 TRINITY_DN30446_c0_g1_i1:65-2989(+)
MAVVLAPEVQNGRPDLRVGGGYSMYGNSWSGSPKRQLKRAQPGKAAVSVQMAKFPAEGVVALEVLQGGATIWTAERDGSINIRNGLSGEVATSSPDTPTTLPAQGTAKPVRLCATETHMWVGYDDGSVRIYDHLVVMQVWPDPECPSPKPHQAAVMHFCPSDGCMVSGDVDGNLVKWCRDDFGQATFASHLAKGTASPEPIKLNALAVHGRFVFAGDDQGRVHLSQIVKVHPETESTYPECFEYLFSWDTAHGSVTALKYMDGLLFTGGTDGSARVCHVPSGAQSAADLTGWTLSHSGKPVQRLVGDPRAHQIWVVDDDGAVSKFESYSPFAKRDELPLQMGRFSDLATFTTWDAMRVWTTGSNGANFAWFAQWSRAEEEMQDTVEGMRHVIDQDRKQLGLWQDQIDELSRIDEDRKKKLTHALASNSNRGLSHIYFRKWSLWLRKLYEVRRRGAIADVLERNMDYGIRHAAWVKLLLYYQSKRALRQKSAVCHNIMAGTLKGMRRIYWKKIDDYRHKKKKEKSKLQLGEALLANTETGVIRKYFRKALRYLDRMQTLVKRKKFAEVLLRTSDSALLRLYYFRLLRLRSVLGRARRRDAIGQALMASHTRGLQRLYYRKFCSWGEGLRVKRQRKELADALRRSTQRGLLAAYQQKCDTWLEQRRREQLEQELFAQRRRLGDLQREEREQHELLKRREELQALRDQLQELNRSKQGLLDDLAKLTKDHEELGEAKRRKEAHEEDLKAKAMTLDDAMARLKEMALNFDSDFDAIQKNFDRCHSTAAASSDDGASSKAKISQFLQAHMNVKAQLMSIKGGKVIWDDNFWPVKGEAFVERCQEKKDAGDNSWIDDVKEEETAGEVMNPPWDLDGRFTKIETFQYNMIGPAIKTMVILYDMMTKGEKDHIKTDGEIVINAHNLMHLCDNAARVKERRPKKEVSGSSWKGKLAQWQALWAEYTGFGSWAEYEAKGSGGQR